MKYVFRQNIAVNSSSSPHSLAGSGNTSSTTEKENSVSGYGSGNSNGIRNQSQNRNQAPQGNYTRPPDIALALGDARNGGGNRKNGINAMGNEGKQ